jgi:hypothetical protein
LAIEKNLGRELFQAWLNSDSMSQNVEAFSSTTPNTIKLRRFEEPSFAVA